jgi:predicted aspartyl protease
MITGEITPDREAVVELVVHGPGGATAPVEFVLDTGFTEHLALPPDLIAALSLPLRHTTPMYLADGSRISVEVL